MGIAQVVYPVNTLPAWCSETSERRVAELVLGGWSIIVHELPNDGFSTVSSTDDPLPKSLEVEIYLENAYQFAGWVRADGFFTSKPYPKPIEYLFSSLMRDIRAWKDAHRPTIRFITADSTSNQLYFGTVTATVASTILL
jgi:hypothetical protein